MKFSIKDLLTFTEEILNENFRFLCSVLYMGILGIIFLSFTSFLNYQSAKVQLTTNSLLASFWFNTRFYSNDLADILLKVVLMAQYADDAPILVKASMYIWSRFDMVLNWKNQLKLQIIARKKWDVFFHNMNERQQWKLLLQVKNHQIATNDIYSLFNVILDQRLTFNTYIVPLKNDFSFKFCSVETLGW